MRIAAELHCREGREGKICGHFYSPPYSIYGNICDGMKITWRVRDLRTCSRLIAHPLALALWFAIWHLGQFSRILGGLADTRFPLLSLHHNIEPPVQFSGCYSFVQKLSLPPCHPPHQSRFLSSFPASIIWPCPLPPFLFFLAKLACLPFLQQQPVEIIFHLRIVQKIKKNDVCASA